MCRLHSLWAEHRRRFMTKCTYKRGDGRNKLMAHLIRSLLTAESQCRRAHREGAEDRCQQQRAQQGHGLLRRSRARPGARAPGRGVRQLRPLSHPRHPLPQPGEHKVLITILGKVGGLQLGKSGEYTRCFIHSTCSRSLRSLQGMASCSACCAVSKDHGCQRSSVSPVMTESQACSKHAHRSF